MKLIVEEPVHTIETNVHGTEVVLKHANKKKKKVVIASTSEVYGKSIDVPFREDADLVMGATVKHRWAYACSKAIDEFLALAYYKERESSRHHRPFLQHRRAPADRDSTAWSCRRSCARRWPAIRSLFTATERNREASPTSAMSSIVLSSSSRSQTPSARCSTSVNNEEVTILRLAELVRELAGSSSKIEFVPYEKAYEAGFEDMPRRVPDLR